MNAGGPFRAAHTATDTRAISVAQLSVSKRVGFSTSAVNNGTTGPRHRLRRQGGRPARRNVTMALPGIAPGAVALAVAVAAVGVVSARRACRARRADSRGFESVK